MQSVSSGVWTRVALSISYDDNHYITGTLKTFMTIITDPLIGDVKHNSLEVLKPL